MNDIPKVINGALFYASIGFPIIKLVSILPWWVSLAPMVAYMILMIAGGFIEALRERPRS